MHAFQDAIYNMMVWMGERGAEWVCDIFMHEPEWSEFNAGFKFGLFGLGLGLGLGFLV